MWFFESACQNECGFSKVHAKMNVINGKVGAKMNVIKNLRIKEDKSNIFTTIVYNTKDNAARTYQ